MQKLKTGYAYLFYFFYNSVNKVKGNILVVFKSVLMVGGLELLVLVAIFFYGVDLHIAMFDLPEDFNRLYLLIPILPIVIFNMWFFERNDNWKKYLEEFNKWPDKKKKKWNVVMRLIIVLVFANLIISFYWMSQIDWKQYR